MWAEMSGSREDSEEEPEGQEGCAFMVEEGGESGSRSCRESRQPGSAYCATHHARCYLPNGSRGEERKLREIEALAEAIGGKQGRPARLPPMPVLERLNRIARAKLRQNRSRIVRERIGDAACE